MRHGRWSAAAELPDEVARQNMNRVVNVRLGAQAGLMHGHATVLT